MNDLAVRCVGLSKSFGQTKAVDNLDLSVQRGHILALLGPSGCGKTTALRLIAGFEVPDKGTVEIAGQLVSGPHVHVPPERRHVGMVFQDYALFPHLDVEGNIAFGLPRGPHRDKRVREVLELVGLEGLGKRMPHELSGGQQQRVALARALAPSPAVILMDEPFSNLDAGLRARVRAEVRSILAAAKATTIFVTHDQEEALFFGDQVAVMRQGTLEQVDTPERVFHRPATPFVASFMGTADFLPAQVMGDTLVTELGFLPRPLDAQPGSKVDVMVRPDDVSIKPVEGGQGRIVERIFQGAHNLYRVRLPSGKIVHSLRYHYQEYPVGAQVEVRIDPGHRLVCFVNGVLKEVPLGEEAVHEAPPSNSAHQ